MEVGGLLILILFGFILLLPFGIILGLLGLAFKGLWWALLFVVKYIVSGAVVGLLVTYIVGIVTRGDFEWQEYVKGAAIGIGIAFCLFLVWLKVIPVNIEVPEQEKIAKAAVSLVTDPEDREYTEREWRIKDLYSTVAVIEYSRTIEELMEVDEEEIPLIVEFFDDEDNLIFSYTIHSAKCIQVGDKYYVPKEKDRYIRVKDIKQVRWDAAEERAQEKWGPFVDELFGSIVYDAEAGDLSFTIPENVPEDTQRYRIEINLVGMRGYEEGGDYQAYKYNVFSEEQKNSSWTPGMTYTINEIQLAVWEELSIEFGGIGYMMQTYDCLPLLPEELVK